MNVVCSETSLSRYDEKLVVQQAIASRILVKLVILRPSVKQGSVQWLRIWSITDVFSNRERRDIYDLHAKDKEA